MYMLYLAFKQFNILFYLSQDMES